MKPLFDRVTIVGLGLIGGSLGMAIRRKKLAREVVGVSRTSSTLRSAKRRGAIDRGATSLRAAVHDAELVVLAAPVDRIALLGRAAARCMPPGSMLTDVGSTKQEIVRQLDGSLRSQKTVTFIGGHPIAGSEQRGIDAARADLFEGACCILTPTPQTNYRALQRVTALWRRVAGRVITMDPAAHDRLLAANSHLPHALAYSLALATDTGSLRCAPQSLLDMTRLAESDPDLWDDIFLSNRAELLAAIDRFDRQLHLLRKKISDGEHRALKRMLTIAQAQRYAIQHR